jgi:bacillithiol biosynthesis cysteine-adding enzyme BshC
MQNELSVMNFALRMSTKVSSIPYARTGRFNKLILNYIDGDAALRPFHGHPNSPDGFAQKLAERATVPCDRDLLARALTAQYAGMAIDTAVTDSIRALQSADTYTVTTGHQLNIFTGPLYFIHKSVHTIRLAQELGRLFPAKRFVPVFWMNAEDHDLNEVGQTYVNGSHLVWTTPQAGATGRMITTGLPELLEQAIATLNPTHTAHTLIELFTEAYDGQRTLAQATRLIVNALFGPYGMVAIDGDDQLLKGSFAHVMLRDLTEGTSHTEVSRTSHTLDEAGYHVQVTPREVNLFYLSPNGRDRIVKHQDGFKVLDRDIFFSADEIRAELQQHPERFSPNVVLRPLYQEHLLPNVAYVGGAGELAYWLQYRSNFAAHGISFPILSLRSHWLLIDPTANRRMTELGLLPEDLFHSTDDLVRSHVLGSATDELNLNAEAAQLTALYDALRAKAQGIDPTLVPALSADEARLQKQLDGYRGRMVRAIRQREEVTINRIRKLHERLFPNGYLQERHDNLLQHWNPDLIARLMAVTDPFSSGFGVIEEVA